MCHAQHEVGDDDQQGDEKERDGGAGGKVTALDAESEGEGGECLRGVEGTAGGEDVDDGHVREGEDEAEEHGDADDGTHHGNDDLELRTPEARAIHRSGFRNVLGNGGAAGEQDDGGKGHETPTVHQEDGSDSEARLAEPHRSAEGLVKMQRNQHPTDDAVDGVQNPFPTDGAESDGRHPRQKNEKADQAAATEGLFQGDGENVGADDHDDLGADGKDEGIANGNSKTGALQNAAEVFQANEMHFGVADAGVAESIKDSKKKGSPDEQQDVENRRGKHGSA